MLYLLARLRQAHPSQAGLQDPSPVPVQDVDGVHVVHDGVAEEHVAILLGLRQGHAPQVQRVALRPAHARFCVIDLLFRRGLVCWVVAWSVGRLVR